MVGLYDLIVGVPVYIGPFRHIIIIIIMMHIYHALINALSARMIHMNLKTIFYTDVEHLPKHFT